MSRHSARVVDFGSRKIHAIKLVRQLSSLGLKEAKDIVESGGTFACEVRDPDREAITEAERAGIRLSFDPPLDSSAPRPQEGWPPASASGLFTVRYGAGPQKISAIKLVRELCGIGLKDAKDLVEQQGVIRSGITRHEADHLATRFAAFGSSVLISDEFGHAAPAMQRSSSPAASEPPPFDPYGQNEGGFNPYADEDDDF